MILILKPNISADSREFKRIADHLENYPKVEMRVNTVQGAEQVLTEVYLIGHTAELSLDEMRAFPGVEHAVRVSEEYRILGRHKNDHRPSSFTYNGIEFSQENLNVFAGLCAVDSPASVEAMMTPLE
jgi:3-deoxy-7-phosphoheptulonate synthase